MSSILLTGPAVEPLSLDEAKTFLRVEHSDDDQVIGALIASARMHVEAQAKIALLTQNWRMVFDCWPHHGRIVVRPGPLRALSAVRVYDINSNPHIVDTQAFVPDFGVSTLAFMPWALPVPGRIAAGIELDVAIGFGDAAADVPEPLRQAIRLLVAHWYENRGLTGTANEAAILPASFAALIASYRELSL
ncbi:MAG: head-tail connector protein [Pseudolabrys sp.]|jgi:uncharacterized phiE125 gp8 family phage protein